MLTAISLIAGHGGSADHFATYAEVLKEQECKVEIHANGPALKKFQDRGVEVQFPFSIDNLTAEEENRLAQTIAKNCSTSSIAITDVGHIFDAKIQEALKVIAPQIPRFAYYDNPERLVPGGYPATAAKVIEMAEGVFFANDTLTQAPLYSAEGKEIDFTGKKRFGIGYYPVSQAEKIAAKRKSDQEIARSTFLKENGIQDNGQEIYVYFGGNNDEYFSKAFPAFLSLVSKTAKQIDLINKIILIQQHPAAKTQNRDGQQVKEWLAEFGEQSDMPKIVLSTFSSDHAQILAKTALYYQTSMGPQFVLAGISAIQIGHETYEDILVRNGLAPTVTDPDKFAEVIRALEKPDSIPQGDLLSSLGIKENWQETLLSIIQQAILS